MICLMNPNSVVELAEGIERYMLDTESLSDPDFDMLNLAAISLRKAATNAPEFMQKVLADAVTLSREAELCAEAYIRTAKKEGQTFATCPGTDLSGSAPLR